MTLAHDSLRLGRRAFLHNGTLLLLGTSLTNRVVPAPAAEQKSPRPPVRFGVVTDLHYADKAPAGARHYREALPKLAEATERFQQKQVDFVAELGDVIDAGDSVEQERGYLKQIHAPLAALPFPTHYVLGNHCVYTLTKLEFLETVGQQKSYYAFDVGGYHFIVLDACFREDGEPYGRQNAAWTDANIPAAELAWLRTDLSQGSAKTIVFVHQCLDVAPPYGIKNAAEVRKVLESSGRVLAVLQGHHHRSDYRAVGGIHYCTLVAMVDGSGPEQNGYALVDVLTDGSLRIQGFRRQPSRTL